MGQYFYLQNGHDMHNGAGDWISVFCKYLQVAFCESFSETMFEFHFINRVLLVLFGHCGVSLTVHVTVQTNPRLLLHLPCGNIEATDVEATQTNNNCPLVS